MSSYGIINTISPPMLEGTAQPELIAFEVEYSAYSERINVLNSNRSASQRIPPATLKQCIRPKLLHSMCILGIISDATSSEDATDEQVEEWFHNTIKGSSKNLAERVQEAVNSVNYQVQIRDPAGAPRNFVLNVITSLDEHNASDVVKDTEQCKELLKKLVHKLQPPELKQRMLDSMIMWTKEQKCSLKYFSEKAGDIAKDVHEGESARKKLGLKVVKISSGEQGTRYGGQHNRNSLRDKYSNEDNKKRKFGQSKDYKDQQTDKYKRHTSSKNNGNWTKPCLNTECDGVHPIKDCPITSKEKKKELLDGLFGRKNKKQKLAKIGVGKDGDGNSAQLSVFLEGVQATALPDYGADHSAISKSLLKKIQDSCDKIDSTRLENPIDLDLAIDTTEHCRKFQASEKVTLNICIILPGSALRVRLRDVEFIVVDAKMNDALLGRPFLKSLGFDFEKHIESVKEEIEGKSMNELEVSNKLSRLSYSGLVYGAVEDDPVKAPSHIVAGFGNDSKESIDEQFLRILEEAKVNNISSDGLKKLGGLLEEHRDCFRIKLGMDPPAKVRPLSIQIKENARPVKSPQRRYAPKHRAFICSTVKELEKIGAVVRNPAAKWAIPALAVPKPGSDDLRFTVDVRIPNSQTEPIQSAMPHLDSMTQDCEGSKYFSNIDFCNGYWQLGLHPNSREMMSIQTPMGIVTPTRVLQGGTDSGNHFQAVTREQFEGKVSRMLQWLEDFLLYAKTEADLLQDIEQFLRVCSKVGFKIHAKKTSFFTTEVKFCGRIISDKGVRFDPRNMEEILTMQQPKTGDQLQQFLCAANWMRIVVPDFSRLTAPLSALMEILYKRAGSRKKRSVKKLQLAEYWKPEHTETYELLKKQLARSTELAHPKSDYRTCLFTDASDTHWSAILTQSPISQQRQTIEEQLHEPLAFLSGSFKGHSENWSVPEKEAFAIVEAMDRLNYLVADKTITIYTDHANLLYIFDPHGTTKAVPRHTASKLTRWAIKLSSYRFEIEHVPGERNVWADLLTRWAVQSNRTMANQMKLSSLMLAPIEPGIQEEFDWPSLDDIKTAQHSTPRPSNLTNSNGLWRTKDGKVWIPPKDSALQLRLLVAAHTGRGGHRSHSTTHALLSKHFHWNNMISHTKEFVNSCLHCCATTSGPIIPRPLGTSLHAKKPNQLIHFDYCHMGKGEGDFTYVLIVKDDLSGYVWLRPCRRADADTTAQVLMDWFSSFGVVDTWISDQGRHFKNELIKLLQNHLKSKHHFTLPYCPWSNGTVEVVCRELCRVCRSLLSEFKLPPSAWPSVIALVQSALNSAPSPKLNNEAPLTIFSGLPADSPICAIVRKEDGVSAVKNIEQERALSLIDIQKTRSSLDEMHRQCATASSKRRQAAIDSHNRKTGVRKINFDVGDFVLKGLLQREMGPKPSLKWRGPYRITAARDNYIFEIEDLLNGKKAFVHGRRLKFFRNKSHDVTEEIQQHLEYQRNELLVIDSLQDIRRKGTKLEILVQWRGFEGETDWVLVSSLREDVPDLLKEFKEDLLQSGTKRQKQIAKLL